MVARKAERGFQLIIGLKIEGVALFRPVQCDDGDMVLKRERDELLRAHHFQSWHDFLPVLFLRGGAR